MNGWWQQTLAGVLAVAIPLITKLLNDLKDRLEMEANSEVPIVGLHTATEPAPQPPADPTPPKGVQAPETPP